MSNQLTGGCDDFALIGNVFDKSFDADFVYEVHFVDHPDGQERSVVA